MKRYSVRYTLGFMGLVCLGCSLCVSLTAVGLKERQVKNARYDKWFNVLVAAGLEKAGKKPAGPDIEQGFNANAEPVVVEIRTGSELGAADGIDPRTFDPVKAAKEKGGTIDVRDVPGAKDAGLRTVPARQVVYRVGKGEGSLLVLPITGQGLWSTLNGFLAIDAGDCSTIRGITFYEHGETPGLGGEIENPVWQARWQGRRGRDAEGVPVIKVLKGVGGAGTPDRDPYQVDGISGATITSQAVGSIIRFWLGEGGYGPYLKRQRGEPNP